MKQANTFKPTNLPQNLLRKDQLKIDYSMGEGTLICLGFTEKDILWGQFFPCS